jgi:cellulose synthase/poly-beta-1,6-N-acetylglucosamine synthase-like glycosyltransferase
MMQLLDPTVLLFQLDAGTALAMFWIVIVFDVPRYTLAFVVFAVSEAFRSQAAPSPVCAQPLVSIVLAGHNERAVIRRCVRSLREQTYRNIQIICVDDGSSDGMDRELTRLRREGLIDNALSTSLRSGKSSAWNLGFSVARGDVVVVSDCDCTFDRDALANLVAPLAAPSVGAVTGNIGVRNAGASILSAMQAVEYLMNIGLGRRILDAFGQVTCASGAFSAFRHSAIVDLGGLDTGAGEDLDLTLRLRQAGWKVRFAERAWCLTDVPATLPRFIRQRLRWERDALRLRLRKHRQSLLPTSRRMQLSELVHQLGFLFTHVLATFAFPLYLIWLIDVFGSSAMTVLVMVTLVFVMLDTVAALCAFSVSDRPGVWWLLPYGVAFGAFHFYLVRSIRLAAFAQEWIFRRSYRDNYVPARVLRKAPVF